MRVAEFSFDTLLYEGASTLVYAGVREPDGAPVVAKMVRDAHRSLTHEYRVLQKVVGSRVVVALGLFEGSDGPVLVERRYGSSSLAAALRPGRFTVRRALRVALQVAQACGQVHAARFIHRDIKPANILYDAGDETATLCDFGTAAELPVNARALPVCDLVGTPAYVSPEHTGRTREGCDVRSDLYSLGITLYELLTGGLPFPDKDLLEIVAAQLSRLPEPPHHRVPSVPLVVSEIVRKLLAKLPDERYQSARGLAADLEHCLETIQPDGQIARFELGSSDLRRPRFPQRLFDRRDEMQALAGALARAEAGEPALVLISGREGSGRSELVRALLRDHASDSLLALGGWSAGDERPLSGLADALGALANHLVVLDEDRLAGLRQQFADRLGHVGQVLLDIVPSLGDVFGPQPPLAALPAAPARARLHHGFRCFTRALGDGAPFVLALRGFEHADPASVSLINAVLSQPASRTLVVLVASDPAAFDGLRERAGAVSIELGPLSAPGMTAWLAATLDCELDRASELALALHAKSAGNPLIFMRLVEHLVETGIIERRDGAYVWSLDAVRAAAPPPTLGALASHRIAELDGETRRALAAVACSDEPIDAAAVAVMLGVGADAAVGPLAALARECLVVDAGGHRAAHPVIARTALAAVGDAEVARMRGRLGAYLLAASPGATGAQALRIAMALCRGAIELADAARAPAAEVHAIAGEHVMASAAYDVAVTLFAGAAALLAGAPASGWQGHRALRFRSELGHARALMMLGKRGEADARFQALASRELAPEELGPVYNSWAENHSMAMDRARAIEIGLEGLARLGLRLPATPRPLQPLAAIRLNQRTLSRLTAQDHIDRPPATDPAAVQILQLLGSMTVPVMFSGRMGLYILVVESAIGLVLRHGHVRNMAGFMAVHACLLHAIRGDYAAARAIYEACSALDLARPVPELAARTSVAFHYMVGPWFGPWHESAAQLARAIPLGIEAGDPVFSALCASASITMLSLLGTPLDRVVGAIEGWAPLLGADSGVAANAANVVNIAGKLSRDEPIAQGDLDRITSVPLAAGSMRNSTMVNLGLALAVVGHEAQVRAWLDEIRPGFPQVNFAAPHRMTLWLLDGLFAARDARSGVPERRAAAEQVLDTFRRLRERTLATNNDPAMALLEAELAWADGELDRAAALFGRAAREARARDLTPIAAYAHEERARMLDEAGDRDEATLFYREAVIAYRRWSHLTKVVQLEQARPSMRIRDLARDDARRASVAATRDETVGTLTAVAAGQTINDQLDLATVLTVSQDISTQLTGSGVVRAVLAGIAQNAGAERVVFVLRGSDGAETVFGELHGGYRDIGIPLERYPQLPRSVVRVVRRTGRPVVVADATGDPAHAADPFVAGSRCRSIAGIPVRHKGEVMGLVVLENRVTAGAFTPQVVSLTQALVAQAAISLDNATLYDELSALNRELEARVEDRTRALRKAQEQLIESARKAGMADVAIEVLHGVGNALNSANVSAQMIERQIAGSKTKTLARTVALLDQHRDDVVAFLTADERGGKLAAMLSMLGRALTGEQEAMLEELVRLRTHIDSVVTVIGQLNTTAEDRGQAMLEAPQVLLAEALAIIAERSGRDRIAIATECQAPGARVDQHKALDILTGLLANAVDALQSAAVTHKQIRVTVYERGDTVVFEVHDNGPGISRDGLTRIFHSGPGRLSDRRGASDLHKLANAAASAGGSLTARSDEPDGGATFTLVLPDRDAADERRIVREAGRRPAR
ncbi:MAG: GAF domain-containing protein [Deltaproteobacteria bacterium]|nr:MAG: GAF domain-containing protein [Deltaproteobacteria bacterium]